MEIVGIILILAWLIWVAVQLGDIVHHLKRLIDQQEAQRANQDEPRY